jgi:hypothetical protein
VVLHYLWGPDREVGVANPKKVVEGHRRAVREHIAKFFDYDFENQKEFALKTVRRVQGEIADVRARARSTAASWEDTWDPSDGDPRREAEADSASYAVPEVPPEEPEEQSEEPAFGDGGGEEAPEAEPEVEAP